MPLDIVHALCARGSGAVNEDAFGFTPDAVWVVDGATAASIDNRFAPSDARWYASIFSSLMTDQLAHQREAPIRQLVANAIVETARRYGERPDDKARQPSAAFAMARTRPDGVELATLGDSRILYRSKTSGTVSFRLTALDRLSSQTEAILLQTQRSLPDASAAQIAEAMRPTLRANRRCMNDPDGYWILALDPHAADHMGEEIIPMGTDDYIILASDGFLRIVELFNAIGLDEFWDSLIARGPAPMLRRLRDLEAGDIDCRRYPRFKPMDDATCVIARIS